MRNITFLFFLCFSMGYSQKLIEAEYFWDMDPGVGNGNPLIAFDGNFNQAIETIFTNSANLPSEGNHVLNVRVKADDGNWSSSFRKVFRLTANNNSNLIAKITQAEYFWDTDPGVGNGNQLIAFDGNFNQAVETIFTNNANLPSEGNHVLNVRVKADDGNWSSSFRKVFRLTANNNSNLTAKITQAEYFWDIDPGVGNGNPLIAFDGNFNQAVETINALLLNNNLSPGLHLLNVRVKADDSNWSPIFKKVIGVNITYNQKVQLVSPLNLTTDISINPDLVWNSISGAGNYEYYLSTDPSFSSSVISGSVTNSTVQILGLQSNTTYYWRVRVNENDNVSLWSNTWSFTTSSSLGLDASQPSSEIILYPIPTNTSLALKFETGISLDSYKIHDFTGKEVKQGEFANDNYTIDVSPFATGTYVLTIFYQNTRLRFKFIKTND